MLKKIKNAFVEGVKLTDNLTILIREIKKHQAEHAEYLKQRQPIIRHKTVDELMEYLENGIKNMRYLSKERQSENNVINLMEYRNDKYTK